MIAAQFARTTKTMVVKEISALVPESSYGILQCDYDKACTGVFPAINTVVEQVLFDLLPRDLIARPLDSRISTYFTSGYAADKVCRELYSTNSFMSSISAFIQRRTSEALDSNALPSIWRNRLAQSYRSLLQNTPC